MSRIDEYNKNTINRLCKDVAGALKRYSVDILEGEDKDVSGNLVGSFGYDESTKTFGNTAIYSKAVEFGFPSGIWIPIERLLQWVKMKITSEEPDANNIARAIRYKIYNEGIDPTLFLLRSIFRLTSKNSL